jgi:hypothetical protein
VTAYGCQEKNQKERPKKEEATQEKGRQEVSEPGFSLFYHRTGATGNGRACCMLRLPVRTVE